MWKTIIAATVLAAIACANFACGNQSANVGRNPQSNSSQTNGELRSRAPDGWVTEKPSSTMRAAQYKLPKADGDPEDATLVLYYFGATQGGSVEANIERWVNQIKQPDGSNSQDKARTETQTINGLKVTTVDITGTYTAEMAPGSADRHNNENYRLRAAVIETPKGNYFAKLVGPANTIARWDQAYLDYLKSFEFK